MSLKEPLDWYAKEGYLTALRQGGLTLYKYTSRCVMEGNWVYQTRIARGLVVDDSGRIVARPMEKFFNANERPETRLEVLPAETPELSEKYDGSLIVSFMNPETGKWQGVTMGSWDNVQTQHANHWLSEHGGKLDPTYTYLFELVGPWNRIVVLYPETRMILIGVIHTESSEDWSYTKVREFGLSVGFDAVRFEKRPISELDLDDPRITNEEGFVARFSNGMRVKIKYSQYQILHKILTGLSIKGIWELESTGQPLDLTNVPDEFKLWFNAERAKLHEAKKRLEDEAKEAFAKAPPCSSRKEYAAYFMKFKAPIPSLCFRMLDGATIDDILWKNLKPSIHKTFQQDDGG